MDNAAAQSPLSKTWALHRPSAPISVHEEDQDEGRTAGEGPWLGQASIRDALELSCGGRKRQLTSHRRMMRAADDLGPSGRAVGSTCISTKLPRAAHFGQQNRDLPVLCQSGLLPGSQPTVEPTEQEK
jgi:hypothetical protein